uniref:Uncharacterized protein n=1 Tax=Glossina morsitans morsitans TaxID=37546 RepID=A0A1B0FB19_GLOMM
MVGRKIGKGYQLYGFTHCIIKGKHVAKCKICDKELQNTAEARMRAHWYTCLSNGSLLFLRNACTVTPAAKEIHELTHESTCKRQIGCSGRANNLDYAKRARTERDIILEGESASIRHEKVNILNSPEEQKARDDIILNELPSPESSSKGSRSGNTYESVMKAKLEYFKQKTNYLNREMDNILIERNCLPFVINAAAYENGQDDGDLLSNIENDSGVVEDSVLYSGDNSQLRQELENAAAEYYHTKAVCYARLAESSEYKKTLLQLEMRKLHLERQQS